MVPKLHGRTVPDTETGKMTRDLKGITTAKDILTSLEIRAVAH